MDCSGRRRKLGLITAAAFNIILDTHYVQLGQIEAILGDKYQDDADHGVHS